MLFTVVGLWANAQVTTSEINGKVVDEKGMALPFATVVAIHEPSGTQYVTTTDNAGNYRLTNLRVGGPYKLSISFVGYSTGVYTDINLNLGESYLQNVKLKESTTSLEEVVVSAGMGNPILSSERTGAQTNISRGDINTLPSISPQHHRLFKVNTPSPG